MAAVSSWQRPNDAACSSRAFKRRSTVLSAAEEAMVAEFRRQILLKLPLDDCPRLPAGDD
jgi:hypothetical protein